MGKIVHREIIFYKIQSLFQSIDIYMTFKYVTIKLNFYLQRGSASKVVIWQRCVYCCHQSSKDLDKNIHHLVPLLCEGFLE